VALDTAENLKQKLGFASFNGHSILQTSCQLLEIPYLDKQGNPLFSRFRLYPPLQDIKYLHPKGIPARPYILPDVWAAAEKPHKPLWITEGEKKALKLINEHCLALALSGVWNFKAGKNSDDADSKELWEELLEFNLQGRTTFLAFDADLWVNPQVRNALWELALKLYGKGAIVKFAEWLAYEGKGIDDYLAKKEHAGENLATVINNLQNNAKELTQFIRSEHEDSIIRALAVAEINELKSEIIVNTLSKKLSVSPRTIRSSILLIKDAASKKQPEFTEEEKQQAIELLKSPDLIERFLETCHSEYRGRDKELIAVKLSITSRKFDESVSLVVLGTSAIGKSAMTKTVLKTTPESEREDFTSVSEQYFLYRKEPLAHRIITFYESIGQGNDYVSYVLRTALSEQALKLGTVGKNKSGELVPLSITKDSKGMVLITTCANGKIDYELDTRVLKIEIAHDKALQRDYYQHEGKLARGEEYEKSCIPFRIWQLADILVEPAQVIIPFANKIADLFSVDNERFNRDFKKILILIKSSALLFQYQRTRDDNDRIIATMEDYELVYSFRELISQSISVVSEVVTNFLNTCQNLQETEDSVTRAAVMKELQLSEKTIRRYINESVANELLETTGRGITQKLKVISIPDAISPMPSPDEIFSDEDFSPLPIVDDVQLSKADERLDIKGFNTGQPPVSDTVQMSDIQIETDNRTHPDKRQCPTEVVVCQEVASNRTTGHREDTAPITLLKEFQKKYTECGASKTFWGVVNGMTGQFYKNLNDVPDGDVVEIVAHLSAYEQKEVEHA